jgi:hypothetical protein
LTEGESASGRVPYTPPGFRVSAFNCPFCMAFAIQTWMGGFGTAPGIGEEIGHVDFSRCGHCESVAVWVDERMVAPEASPAPMPNSDLPDEIRNDYLEARAIVTKSPRGSAALSRLCIQKLIIHLGQPGKNLNDDIAQLVQEGLTPTIQRALDIVRVIGNNAVHPGEIDLRDDAQTATTLLELINAITDGMISQPKQVEELYSRLPEEDRNRIEARDKLKDG